MALTAVMWGSFRMGSGDYNLYGEMGASFTFIATSSGVTVLGSGSVEGGVTLCGAKIGGSLGISFDEKGYRIRTPGPFDDLRVDW